MNINFRGRQARSEQRDDQYDVYEADAERLYDSFSDLYDDFDEGRSKTPFVIIGALLAVAIVGGGLAFAYKRGGNEGGDGPAVILAERTPTKVEPTEPGGIEIRHQDRQIFEEVAGQSGEEQAGEGTAAGQSLAIPAPVRESPTAVTSGIGVAPSSPDANTGTDTAGDGGLTIGTLASRVTSGESGPLVRPEEIAAAAPAVTEAVPQPTTPAPASPQEVARLASPEAAGQASPESLPLSHPSPSTGVFQPRRVPTVTIGPDGSVVTEPAPEPAQPEVAAPQPATPEQAAPAPAAPDAGTTAARALPVPPGATPVAVEPQGEQVAPSGLRLPPGSAVESVLRSAPEVVDPASQTSLFAPSPRPKPRPTTRVAATPPAASTSGATRPTIPAPVRNPAAAPSALQGFAVQVASHRQQSEAVAAFADLQQRFPSLITGFQPLIQRADLGDRGIYYRLRIGPVATKADANRLCSSLKSAGLPGCLVRPL